MNKQTKTVVLAAGGTGGHVMPAAALSTDLLARGINVHWITDARGAWYASSFSDKVGITKISAAAPTGSPVKKAKAAIALGYGALQAWRIFRKLRPSAVVGFGGYPSLPAVWTAQRMGIPTVLHEQNAIIGKANMFMAPLAKRIALSMPISQNLKQSLSVRCIVTGNPVRAEISALAIEPYRAPEQDGELRIFILGGSLGASIFSDVVPSALALLQEEERQRITVTQHCRADDLQNVKDAYEDAGINATLATFFDDVAGKLAASHLVIARAGASMVAEITVSGRPAIFVPYPHHADQQQAMNAQTVEAAGGAWVMPEGGFTAQALAARIETFLQSPEILFDTANKAHACGKPDAARKLGNLVTAIAKGW